ncbi:MAG TPA: glycosyltransferase [Drouetiella sp.]
MTSAIQPANQIKVERGINVAGYLTSESGVAEATRGYVKALQHLGYNVALNNFEVGVQSRKEDKTFSTFASNNPHAINLVCVNADQMPAFIQHFGTEYFKDKYNIAVWWWETPDFPEEWWEHFNYFDEIWVGSSYIQRAIANVSPVPVVAVQPVVEPRTTVRDRAKFDLPENEFLLLCVFDFLSSFERKNPLACVEAFKQAFTSDQPVRLVLKCINGDKNPELLKQLQQKSEGSKVAIIDRYLSADDNQILSNSCDAYISLHRAEGLGLPIAEAMLNKKPVVVTGWSGNMDFNSIANSYLVSYKLIANQTQVGPYKIADTWADADPEHAASQLRRLYANEIERAAFVETAFKSATEYFSKDAVAQTMQTRLSAIGAFNRPAIDSASNGLSAESSKEKVCHVDPLTEQRLRMIESGEDPADSSQTKSRIRKTMMKLVEKSGYLNGIYSALFRKLFVDNSKTQTKVELMESRTRRALADADRRIAALEKRLNEIQNNK